MLTENNQHDELALDEVEFVEQKEVVVINKDKNEAIEYELKGITAFN